MTGGRRGSPATPYNDLRGARPKVGAAMLTIQHFIDGRHVDAASGEAFDKTDPATGRVVARVPDGDARDVDAAAEAAVRAFPRWSHTPTEERARLLLKIADR